MAPYCISLGEQAEQTESSMSHSQDTSVNDQFSDDDELFDDFSILSSPPVIPVPDILPADNSLPQLLAQSCGTTDYHAATSVRLRVIATQTSLQRLHIYLPHLLELDLTGSYLQSLRTLGYGLDSLEVLRVGRCSLTTLDGLFGVTGLRELHAPHNAVSDLGLLATLPVLSVLDLQSNQVASLMQVGFLSMSESLRELTLAECPVSRLPGYKASVVTSLPRLTRLDGSLLAEGGTDLCHDGRQHSPDQSDKEDGATSLSVENHTLHDSPKLVPDAESVKSRRPATVSGARSRSDSTLLVLPERPATAAPKGKAAHMNNSRDPETLSDSVSTLTSGGVVCGNLAAALRGKHRQRKPAWQTEESEKGKSAHKNGLTVSQLYSEVDQLVEQKAAGGDNDSRPLLTASQQWREAYHSFRKSHRTLGYGLDSLEVLRVGRCSLTTLDGLFGVTGLRELHAPHNAVSDLGLLATLPVLSVLDLQSNQVASLMQVGFLSMCESLRELTLAECPVSRLPGYKASVVTSLPRLTRLDGSLLAEGGTDLCHDGRQHSPDQSDKEDGATSLSVENHTLHDSPKLVPDAESVKSRRPATVSGARSRSDSTLLVLPERPATAAPKGKAAHMNNSRDPETLSDSVSTLTSGGVVCGNLAAALRGKHRQRKPAWQTEESEKGKSAHKNGLTVSQLYSEVDQLVEQKAAGGDNDSRPLLTASQQWREAYHSFRKSHRDQWNKEDAEEAGS